MCLETELQFHVLRRVNARPGSLVTAGWAARWPPLGPAWGSCVHGNELTERVHEVENKKGKWIRTRNRSLFRGSRISRSSELKRQRWTLPNAFPLALVRSWEHGPCLFPDNRPGPHIRPPGPVSLLRGGAHSPTPLGGSFHSPHSVTAALDKVMGAPAPLPPAPGPR